MDDLIKQLPGPIAVIGANGFIGSVMFGKLTSSRKDVFSVGRNKTLLPAFSSIRLFLNFSCSRGEFSECIRSNASLVEFYLSQFDSEQMLINAGTSMEYGETAAPTEDSPATGLDLYGKTKAIASQFIHLYGKYEGKRCCNLRLSNVYGPGDHEKNFIPTLIREAKKGKLPPITTKPTTRDFIHVDDICRAFVLAALNLKPENYGESFNIGTGIATPIFRVADKVRKISGIDAPLELTREPGPNDYTCWYSNPKKAEELLNFKYSIELDDGLRGMIHGAS